MPRLSRFYGGGPSDWLRTPVRLLRCYMLMLPRLQAEEALAAVAVGVAAQPLTDRRTRRRLLADWERATEAEAARPTEQPLTPAELQLRLARMGIATGSGSWPRNHWGLQSSH